MFRQTLLTLAAVAVSATSLVAQTPTLPTPGTTDQHLVSMGPVRHGGWGGVDARYTSLMGSDAILTGIRGGWLLNRKVSIGLSAVGNVTTRMNTGHTLPNGREAGLEFAYGGLEFGYITQPAKLMHVSLWTLVGAGGVSYRDPAFRRGDEEQPVDGFFVAEPMLSTELNISRHFRISAGTSYRYVQGAKLDGMESSDLSGIAYSLMFKFGGF